MSMSTNAPIAVSLFSILKSQLGERVTPFQATKTSLVDISHSFEDAVLVHRLPSVVFTGFQESSYWKQETERYLKLAGIASQICIFAGGTPSVPEEKHIAVTLRGEDPLRQEWFLLILCTQFSVVISGLDNQRPFTEEATRSFETILSFEPAVINAALDYILPVVDRYRPDRAAELRAATAQFPPRDPDGAIATELMISIFNHMQRRSDQRAELIHDLVELREQLIIRLTAQQQALGASIQAREQAERAARAEADFALQVMQTMGEGLTIVDAEGHFTFVNDAYARLIGSTPAALVGRSPFEMSPATDYATLQAAGAARARGEGSTYLSQLRRADGSLVDVQITGTPRYIDGQCVGSVAVITDLRARLAAEAERLRLERQLLEAQRLESIGTLAGGVAHDFNNLLMAVLGHAELLRLDLPPDSPLGPSVQQIMAGVNQAAELTRQLLAYAGRGQVTRQPVRLNDLIAELGRLLHAVIPPAAQLRYQLAPALPPVIADPTQLRQVLLNLLTNAAEAVGPAGGQITVSTQPVTLHTSAVGPPGAEALAPGAYIQLTVGDTGSGMDAATQARMFEPFYSTKFTGRGLGLAAVQGIVRSHGGAIHVTSAPGAGTAVVVWLPACEAPVPVAAPRAAEGTAAVAGTVLMIDDEAPVRAVTRRLLEHLGMRVLEAEGGAQGLALLADHAGLITAVLLDLTMPEMGGVEVARQLAQRAPHIPVIVMSGYSAEEVEQQMGRLPLAGRLQKPFTLQSLRACLAALTPAAAKRG